MASVLGTAASSIVFCASATVGLNQAIQGTLSSADHCVVDNRAHNAILRTLANTGVPFDIADLYDIEDILSLEEIIGAMRPNTRLACLTHVSNVTGSIFPVAAIIRAIRIARPDVAVLVDSSQAAGLVDLQPATQADFVVFSGHKYLHGVPGAAVLVANRKYRPLIFGGTGSHSATLLIEDLPNAPVEVGTFNESAISSLAAVMKEAYETLSERQQIVDKLTVTLWAGLKEMPLRLLGRPPGGDRIGVIAMQPALGNPETDWVPYLHSQGIVARGGLHCAPSVHQQFGLTIGGTLRVSVSIFNTTEDVAEFLSAARDFLTALRMANPGT